MAISLKLLDLVEGVGITVISGLAVTSITFIVKWLRGITTTVSSTNNSLASVISNHLPHLQQSLDSHKKILDEQTTSLNEIKIDVRVLGTEMEAQKQRLEDTRSGVKTLGQAFWEHIQSSKTGE